MDPKISIIVPIYNKEQTIERCLKSLMEQTYKNIEIICINDGSTDSSFDKIQTLRLEDNRIKIYSQENEGVGYTRNRGIFLCSGEYLLFVDADDWLDKACCEKLIDIINIKQDTDIILYDYINIYKKTTYKINRVKDCIHKYNKTSFNISETPEIIYITASSCQQLYKKQFIEKNNIKFPELKINSEDLYFWLTILLSNPKLEFSEENFYYYDKTICNSSSKSLTKSINDTFTSLSLLQNSQKYINATKVVKDTIISYYSLIILNCWSSLENKKDINKYNIVINKFVKEYRNISILKKTNKGFLFLRYRKIYCILRKVILIFIKMSKS